MLELSNDVPDYAHDAEPRERLELVTNSIAMVSGDNGYNSRRMSQQVDKVLEGIRELREDMRSHQVTQDARWRLLQSLGLCRSTNA